MKKSFGVLLLACSILSVNLSSYAQTSGPTWQSYLPQKAQEFFSSKESSKESSKDKTLEQLPSLQQGPAPLVEKTLPHFSYAPVVKKISPAVVSIFAIQVSNSQNNPFIDDPFFQFFFNSPLFDLPRQELSKSLGSAVLIDARGYLVTCHHVVDNAKEISVHLQDGRTFKATVVLKDQKLDVAILKVETSGNEIFPFVELSDSNILEVGDVVIAIGYPFGINHTVTTGILSALNTKIDKKLLLQTDAAINPGNSGGGLFNTLGELVGIPNAILSKSGASHGVRFAIPGAVVKPLIEAALNGTDVKRPWLGITCQALTPEIASSLGLNYLTGAIVSNVHPLSPLKDHLQDGDVIVAINTKPISSSEEIDFILNTHKIGDKVSINFIRRGKAETLELILEEAPSLKTETTFEVTESKYLKGVVLAQSKNSKGMIVIDILKDSAALSLGIEKGDVLLKINTIDVSSMQDVKTALSKGVHGISLVIDKNGQIVNLRVQF